ncbi:MAG: hypothetical protein UT48_C0017G0013 [Parcubacteria group bacterium GW2011_GWE2_39_37]|uniref:Uncharacterized protein n=1 Tax=Candidatus Falkowbacteria bacterium GW2011_GWF2_39_8 TaxID=1618642 RepID=A0A0G0Q503_9BACT|nr:MAG: hypothetical protein UT48_C0017G0013 [Parcubacteria group bacterium GW2011_GWE2_39_37]KKR32451.1 MAG: hypothetical protein UT64_C0034G0007 [Candidatus Falkowbacteria bacterium GW2011_GWF2_39_8]
MKKMLKQMTAFAAVLVIVSPVFLLSAPANALDVNDAFGGDTTRQNIETNLGLGNGNKGPQEIAASIINVALGFLGIIAVVLILIAGFQWMTAGGDTGKVDSAKKTLGAALIGLVIILAAWGIANYVLKNLINATGTNT